MSYDFLDFVDRIKQDIDSGASAKFSEVIEDYHAPLWKRMKFHTKGLERLPDTAWTPQTFNKHYKGEPLEIIL